MDIKAMAKSKRSHTRHHQPRKPHLPNSSTTTAAATSNFLDPEASKRDAKGPTQPPSLPSNWARYEDEDLEDEQVHELPIDSDSCDPSRLAASKLKAAPDAVEPKSKGADFEYLIAQAKESKSTYSPSFDDTLPDFYQGLGPMLAVKGESILSRDRRDNYLLEVERTASQEAPFLRLDLEALAEQLEKVDLAKRLFIEADLLPPELRTPEHNEADKSAEKKKAEVAGTYDELLSLYLEAEEEAERHSDEDRAGDHASSSAVIRSCNPDSKLDDLGFLDAEETSLVNHVTKPDPQLPSRFDAMAAEAELGMLLNSFSERNPFDSSEGDFATHGDPSHLLGPFKPAMGGLDEALDDLLEETSKPKNNKVGVFQPSELKTASSQHLLGPFKPEFPAMGGLDEALDDLLGETSKPKNNKDGVFQSKELKAASSNLPSYASSSTHPSSNSKGLDDFDSWFDTL